MSLAQLAHGLDDFAVGQAEITRVLGNLDVGDARHQAIEQLCRKLLEPGFSAP